MSKFDTMQRRFDAIPVHQNVDRKYLSLNLWETSQIGTCDNNEEWCFNDQLKQQNFTVAWDHGCKLAVTCCYAMNIHTVWHSGSSIVKIQVDRIVDKHAEHYDQRYMIIGWHHLKSIHSTPVIVTFEMLQFSRRVTSQTHYHNLETAEAQVQDIVASGLSLCIENIMSH